MNKYLLLQKSYRKEFIIPKVACRWFLWWCFSRCWLKGEEKFTCFKNRFLPKKNVFLRIFKYYLTYTAPINPNYWNYCRVFIIKFVGDLVLLLYSHHFSIFSVCYRRNCWLAFCSCARCIISFFSQEKFKTFFMSIYFGALKLKFLYLSIIPFDLNNVKLKIVEYG